MLTDRQMETLANLLRSRTALNRLAHVEVITALRFMESHGYEISDTSAEREVLTSKLRAAEYDRMFNKAGGGQDVDG